MVLNCKIKNSTKSFKCFCSSWWNICNWWLWRIKIFEFCV